MATEKQIAANRANAKRSTGPKTAQGKSRSSRNAFRHGLSSLLLQDELSRQKIDALARTLADGAHGRDVIPIATEMTRAQIALLRIDKVRAAMMQVANGHTETAVLRRAAALDRYERYARTKRRRAAEQLEATVCPDSSPNQILPKRSQFGLPHSTRTRTSKLPFKINA